MTGNRTANPITNIIVGVAFVALGVALFVYWGKPTFDKAQASKSWPTVSGVVKTSTVTVSETRDHKKRSTMYTPEIAFAYEIEGHSYVSSQIGVSSGYSSSSSSSAYQLTSKYPVGEHVEVAYDPANPSFAVLETGASWSTYFIYYMGPGFVGLGLFAGVGPVVMFVFALCFARSSTTRLPSSQPVVDSRFPGEDSSSVYPGHSTAQSFGAPIDSGSTNEISEGITIQ